MSALGLNKTNFIVSETGCKTDGTNIQFIANDQSKPIKQLSETFDRNIKSGRCVPNQIDQKDSDLGQIKARDVGDGSVTIYKDINFKGKSTEIYSDNICVRLDLVPGGWDRKVRSLITSKGWKCNFYL
jgi:hypothetical protein